MSGYLRIPEGLRDMALAAFFFSLMSLLVKLVGQRLPASEVVMARSVVSLAISWVMLRRVGIVPWGRRKGLLTVRGLVGFVALLCFFYAIPRLPLADVTTIQFTNPAFTALFAAVFIRERMTRTVVFSIALSLAGVTLIAQPTLLFGSGADALDLTAVGIALLGAVFAALAYTTVRKLRETEHALVVVFYFPLVSIPACLPIMAPVAVWPTAAEWLMLIGIGVLTQIAQIFLTNGLHKEKAGRATSVSYLQILFAALWGFLFFGEIPDGLTVLGVVLVISGVVYVARASNQAARSGASIS
ncbi:MAG: DMT family transporter [Rhodothermales bacterium]